MASPNQYMLVLLQVLDSEYCFDDDGMYPSVSYNQDDPHRSYMESIEMMPMTAGPGVFGLHENANIACALAETFEIFDTILLMEVGNVQCYPPDEMRIAKSSVFRC